MQTEKPLAPSLPQSHALIEQLSSRHNQSALAAKSRFEFEATSDAFVGALSEDAKVFLSQLQPPTPGGPPGTAPLVPPALGEELFAFADYALIPELQGPAIDAMMQQMSVPRALKLLYTCCTVHQQHTHGYVTLKHRLQAYLVANMENVRKSCVYQGLRPHERVRIDGALRREMDYTLNNGTQRDFVPLQNAIVNHIEKGCFTPKLLDRRQFVAWLCEDASVKTWTALQAQGHDIVSIILRRRAAAFVRAVHAGRTDLVKAMWETVPLAKRDILWNADEHGALCCAILRSDTRTIALLIDQLTLQERMEVTANMAVWDTAAQSFGGSMVRHLRERLPFDGATQFIALQRLVAQGHHAAMSDLLQDFPNARFLLSADVYGAFRAACANGDTHAMRLLLAAAERHPDILPSLITYGLMAACTQSMAAAQERDAVALIDEAAQRHGLNPFATLGHQTLACACEQGQVEILSRVICSITPASRWPWLITEADVQGRHMSLLTAACTTAQHAVVDAILDWAGPRALAAILVLQHNGAALLAATESGDVALLERLLALAMTSHEEWAAWLTHENAERMLRRAMGSNKPRTLQAWLDVIPSDRHAAVLGGGRLVTEGLYNDADATLEALFARAADANEAALTTAFVQEAIPGLTDSASPLAFALRHGFTEAADVVLGRLDSPRKRQQVQRACFEALCNTDLAYFRLAWDTFTEQERATLLTPRLLAELPLHASTGVAVYLMRNDPQAFTQALEPLPVPELTRQQCETALELIRAAPSSLQDRITQAWGETLLRTAMDFQSPDIWEFALQGLGQEAVLQALADENGGLFLAASGPLYTPVISFVVLSGAWLRDPNRFGELGQLAVQDMVHDDNVTLLREFLARYPNARRHRSLRHVLRPHVEAWALSKPRIATFLNTMPTLARPPGNVT